MKKYGSVVVKRYTYWEVNNMTNSFKVKLGQGGYGSVYKGTLSDSRLVAVKILLESTGDGEEFINEVASISRTAHVNIVALVGFCYGKTKRALIYEFLSKGSLDKFIYYDEPTQTNPCLDWETLHQISLGIARGLQYLHQGCSTRILHFDIKPQNILLDEDLCPKISDFGLAKLCERRRSEVSLVAPRGTVGYMAPEVYSRSLGAVSHKSDVYSYGMLILEMMGGRQNLKDLVSNTSEMYFPDWIYKLVEGGRDLGVLGSMSSEEEGIVRKLILVSLWCIQTIPSGRPSMTKVVEMLEGSVESLQAPPEPCLSTAAYPLLQLPSTSSTISP
ncbi:hypothetical protein K2173_001367 [Erythroxylum novogranatense]|uniref:Protein kinase domain-containing protein n=1 Tax=Erythroxylum novogranatense TaxID=1862640 RepID=A0AAV8T4L9_9ROSI|nr:hypothetical protein K2173_001367 [Erythroxylum novogranatense]